MRLPFNDKYRLSQGWGERPEVYKQFGLKGHNGLDYATPIGVTIVSPHEGVVEEAYLGDKGYGNYIKIENDTEGSILAHLKSLNVAQGDKVKEGQVIGLSNNTGFSTAPHLHWGYFKKPRNRKDGYGGYINQEPLLDASPSYSAARQYELLVKKSTQYDEVVMGLEKKGYTITHPDHAMAVDVLRVISGIESHSTDLTGTLSELRQEFAEYKVKNDNSDAISSLDGELTDTKKLVKTHESTISDLRGVIGRNVNTIKELRIDIARCKAGQVNRSFWNWLLGKLVNSD